MILLKNCYYIATFDDEGEEFYGRDILIRGSLIDKIAEDIQLTDDEKSEADVIDCSHFLVMPGMVNTHHHLYQTLTRNLAGAQNAKLFDWLVHLYPIWSRIDEDAVYYSTLLGCAELLLTGATTTTDHLYLYPENFGGDMMSIQFEAAEKLGIRFSPSRGSMTLGRSGGGLPPDDVVQSPDEVLRDMERVAEKFHNSDPLSMKKIVFAPCSPFSVDETVMIESAKLARKHDIVLHTHLAETKDEEQFCLEKYGKRPLELMADWDWLGDDVFFAHGIWFDDGELKILSETNTGISHCPTSNMRLGSGIARIKEMLDMNIRVGLGVDGSASNDSSDMLGEVRNAMLLQRVKYGADAMSARQALKIATRGGAELLKFNKIAQIREGFAADLVMFDLSKMQYSGAKSDPLAAIVFTGFDHSVAYSIVNGKVVVQNGELVGVDVDEISNKVDEISSRMLN